VLRERDYLGKKGEVCLWPARVGSSRKRCPVGGRKEFDCKSQVINLVRVIEVIKMMMMEQKRKMDNRKKGVY
jgi:hypothetical protein